MSSIDKPIVESIADGEDVDWNSVGELDEPTTSLKQIDAVARAFRRRVSGRAAAGADELFRWRHLKVIEPIGEGGFGRVFRAYDSMLRREVALKLAHEGEDPLAGSALIAAEARKMAQLRHPNILAIHGVDEIDGQTGIWCDLLSGSTLDDLLAGDKRRTPSEVLDIAMPLCSAIRLIHQRNLCHGDIKPSNIMIQSDGMPVLMDFGAAVDSDAPVASAVGSPVVMAPEQFDGGTASPESDIYAFGVVLYRAIAGRYPVNASSVTQLDAAHAAAQRVRFDEIPYAWRPLLKPMLARSPEARPSAAQVQTQLERLVTAPRRRRRAAVVAVVVGALSVGAGAALFAYSSADAARNRLEAVKDVFVESMAQGQPQRQSAPVAVERIYEALAERSQDRLAEYPAAAAELQLLAAQGLGYLGQTERALEIAKPGIALLEKERGDVPRDLAHGYLTVATLKTRGGDYVGAEEAIMQVLHHAERLGGEAKTDLQLIARNRLALLAGEQGLWPKELRAQQSLIEARRQTFGSESIRLAVDHHNLARAYLQLGDTASAITHESEAARLLELHGDSGSIRMGFIKYGLAMAFLEARDRDASRAALGIARALYEAAYSEGHPDLLSIGMDEARWQIRFGDASRGFESLEALLVHPNMTDNLRMTVRRRLAEEAVFANRWALGSDQYAALVKLRPIRYRLLEDYFEAAWAYAEYRQEKRSAFPQIELARAADALDALTPHSLSEKVLVRQWLNDDQ